MKKWRTLITIYPRGRKTPSHKIESSGDHGWNGAMAEALVTVNKVCRKHNAVGKVVVETWKGESKIWPLEKTKKKILYKMC